MRVPADATTISKAMQKVRRGGLVLVSPGTYRESVRVDTPGVTLRGTDRNSVVLDGEGTRSDGVVVTAPEVSVENLSVRRYSFNGVLVTGMMGEDGIGLGRGSTGYKPLDPHRFPALRGFAVRYVTASGNGLYGIYAFDSRDGVIERNHASGSADSGIYLGQCKPCGVTVRDNVAEHNAVGFENANASGDVYVVGNRLARNRVGLTVTSDYQEAFVPQQGSVIAGNVVSDNDSADSPAHAEGAFGVGVGIGGGRDNTVSRNRIEDNVGAGLVLSSHEDLAPEGNRIEGNRFGRNGADLMYTASRRAPGSRNCLTGNTLASLVPRKLDERLRCPARAERLAGEPPRTSVRPPPGVSFLEVPPPAPQPSMPAPEKAPHPPARGVLQPDWKSLRVPERGLLAAKARGQ